MKQSQLLSNKTILITRPAGREKNLCNLIEQAGGKVIHYPVISILPPTDCKQLEKLRDNLHLYTMAIFISPTAVEQSLRYFHALPEHFTVVSIGSKTSETLARHNILVDIEAPQHNTESLLLTSKFQHDEIQDQCIIIFRGIGGRDLLGNTLLERGAQIDYAETYQRAQSTLPPLEKQQIKSLDAITISSNEGLDNLISIVKDHQQLFKIPLIVPSERAEVLAKNYGFKIILSSKNATDNEVLKALTSYFSPC